MHHLRNMLPGYSRNPHAPEAYAPQPERPAHRDLSGPISVFSALERKGAIQLGWVREFENAFPISVNNHFAPIKLNHDLTFNNLDLFNAIQLNLPNLARVVNQFLATLYSEFGASIAFKDSPIIKCSAALQKPSLHEASNVGYQIAGLTEQDYQTPALNFVIQLFMFTLIKAEGEANARILLNDVLKGKDIPDSLTTAIDQHYTVTRHQKTGRQLLPGHSINGPLIPESIFQRNEQQSGLTALAGMMTQYVLARPVDDAMRLEIFPQAEFIKTAIVQDNLVLTHIPDVFRNYCPNSHDFQLPTWSIALPKISTTELDNSILPYVILKNYGDLVQHIYGKIIRQLHSPEPPQGIEAKNLMPMAFYKLVAKHNNLPIPIWLEECLQNHLSNRVTAINTLLTNRHQRQQEKFAREALQQAAIKQEQEVFQKVLQQNNFFDFHENLVEYLPKKTTLGVSDYNATFGIDLVNFDFIRETCNASSEFLIQLNTTNSSDVITELLAYANHELNLIDVPVSSISVANERGHFFKDNLCWLRSGWLALMATNITKEQIIKSFSAMGRVAPIMAEFIANEFSIARENFDAYAFASSNFNRAAQNQAPSNQLARLGSSEALKDRQDIYSQRLIKEIDRYLSMSLARKEQVEDIFSMMSCFSLAAHAERYRAEFKSLIAEHDLSPLRPPEFIASIFGLAGQRLLVVEVGRGRNNRGTDRNGNIVGMSQLTLRFLVPTNKANTTAEHDPENQNLLDCLEAITQQGGSSVQLDSPEGIEQLKNLLKPFKNYPIILLGLEPEHYSLMLPRKFLNIGTQEQTEQQRDDASNSDFHNLVSAIAGQEPGPVPSDNLIEQNTPAPQDDSVHVAQIVQQQGHFQDLLGARIGKLNAYNEELIRYQQALEKEFVINRIDSHSWNEKINALIERVNQIAENLTERFTLGTNFTVATINTDHAKLSAWLIDVTQAIQQADDISSECEYLQTALLSAQTHQQVQSSFQQPPKAPPAQVRQQYSAVHAPNPQNVAWRDAVMTSPERLRAEPSRQTHHINTSVQAAPFGHPIALDKNPGKDSAKLVAKITPVVVKGFKLPDGEWISHATPYQKVNAIRAFATQANWDITTGARFPLDELMTSGGEAFVQMCLDELPTLRFRLNNMR